MKTTRRTFIGSLAASTVPASVAVSKPVPTLSDEEQLELCISQLREVLLRLHPKSKSTIHQTTRIVESRPDGSWRIWMRGDVEFEEYSGEGLYEISMDGYPHTWWLQKTTDWSGYECYRATYWENGRLSEEQRDMFSVHIMRKLDWTPG